MEQVIVTQSSTPAVTIKDTRAALGMGLFLLALGTAFTALFILYGTLRGSMPAWPPIGTASLPILIPAVNTLVVLVSALTMRAAVRALAKSNATAYSRYLLMTANFGALFLLLQVLFARQAMELGIVAGGSLYSSVLYALTGFHAVHLLVGVVAIAMMSLATSSKRARSAINRARLWGLYWNFLALVWMLMFVFVFAL